MGSRTCILVVTFAWALAWSGRSKITFVPGSPVAEEGSPSAVQVVKTFPQGDSSVMVGSLDQQETFSLKRATRPDTAFAWKSRIWLKATCFRTRWVDSRTPAMARLRIDSLWESVEGSQGSGLRKGNLLMDRREGQTSMTMEGEPLSERFRLLVVGLCPVDGESDTNNPPDWLPPRGAKEALRWDLDQGTLQEEWKPILAPGVKSTFRGEVRLDSIASFGGERCRFVRSSSSFDAPKANLPLPKEIIQKRTVVNQVILYVVPEANLSQPRAITISMGMGLDGIIQSPVNGVWLDNELRYVGKTVVRAQQIPVQSQKLSATVLPQR